MVADLVGDHVGPGEVAGGAELARHVVVEGEVEVDALVGRAVERPDRRGRAAAAVGLHGTVVDDELRPLVGVAVLLEAPVPGLLGVVEDVVGELEQVALGVLVGRDRALVLGARRLDPGPKTSSIAKPLPLEPPPPKTWIATMTSTTTSPAPPPTPATPPGIGSPPRPPLATSRFGAAPRTSITSRPRAFLRRHFISRAV